jgi:hypothetical protein
VLPWHVPRPREVSVGNIEWSKFRVSDLNDHNLVLVSALLRRACLVSISLTSGRFRSDRWRMLRVLELPALSWK